MAGTADVIAFKARFVEFSEGDDALIAAALDQSDIWLDVNSWASTGDFALARQYLVAHLMTLSQEAAESGQSADLRGGVGGNDPNLFVRSVSFGERSVVFQQRRIWANMNASGPEAQFFSTSSYGQMYLALRRRNIAPVVVV